MNLTMEIKLRNHAGTPTRAGYRALTAKTPGKELEYTTITGDDVVSFVEAALQDLVKTLVNADDEAADISINSRLSPTLCVGEQKRKCLYV